MIFLIEFEDHWQDLLSMEIDTKKEKIIQCGPFHQDIYLGKKTTQKEFEVGGFVKCFYDDTERTIKYPIESVKIIRLTIDITLPIGPQLKPARIAAGIPQQVLAHRMGIKQRGTISAFENATGAYKEIKTIGIPSIAFLYCRCLGETEIIIQEKIIIL